MTASLTFPLLAAGYFDLKAALWQNVAFVPCPVEGRRQHREHWDAVRLVHTCA